MSGLAVFVLVLAYIVSALQREKEPHSGASARSRR